MIETFQSLTEIQQVLAIIAACAGLLQVVLFLALIVHGGRVSLWPGIVCVVAAVVLVSL